MHLDSVHADDVSDLEDLGMLLQLVTEDGAADPLVGLIHDLQAGAEICGQRSPVTHSYNYLYLIYL